MALKVSIVVGNPKPLSRTRKVAELLVGKLLLAGSYDLEVIDLSDHVAEVFAWPSERMAALSASVAQSDLAVFASPTYKATYTGLLKAFLDRYPANGLAGVAAIPVHTGADHTHAMGPMVSLAPLLAELGAAVPGRGFYMAMSEMDRLDEVTAAAAAEYAVNLRRFAIVAHSVASSAHD